MKTKTNIKFLLKSAFFVISFCLATYMVLWIEKLKPSDLGTYKNLFMKERVIKKSDTYKLRKPVTTLSAADIRYAMTAWKYFENNVHPQTGLINSRDQFQAFTMADLSDYLMGMFSAYELNLIDSLEMDRRLQKVFVSLKKLPLFQDKLPNKFYDPATLRMLDENNDPTDKGIGWSALDIGRFYTTVEKIVLHYPLYVPQLRNALNRWKMNDMIFKGDLYSMTLNENKLLKKVQEGRLGWEEYCSKSLTMAGYDVSEAASYTDFLKFVDLYDVEVGVDTRERPGQRDANYVLSDPYVLDGLEYGWDVNSIELAQRVFKAQKGRYEKTGVVTAVNSDFIFGPPYYVYNTLYADDKIWCCIDKQGNDAEDFKSLSTRAAFGWSALFQDPYSDVLISSVKNLYNPSKGWYSGRFEKSGRVNTTVTATTNGMILEALRYKKNGRLVRF